MEIREMTPEQIEERTAAIETEMMADDADLKALTQEARDLLARKNEIQQRAAEERALKESIAVIKTAPVLEAETFNERSTQMENVEIRNTKAYIDAYAKYVDTGDDRECRALYTENKTNGTVPVPEFVYEVVKTAWENDKIMSRIRKAHLGGNVKIGFEISATGATVQTEGAAVDEQTLVMGIVEMKPAMIKKWISISNQALRIESSEEYLTYIYKELAHHIAKKAADTLITKIIACGTQSTTTCVGVPKITSTTVTLDLVAKAIANLSDEAANPVIIMNKLTYAEFKSAQAAGSYAYDPFEGCDVLFNNSLTAFTAATTGVCYAIVGDLEQGALANFPDGEEVSVLRDPYTLATSNMVRFVGDMYVGIEPVAPNAFVKICH